MDTGEVELLPATAPVALNDTTTPLLYLLLLGTLVPRTKRGYYCHSDGVSCYPYMYVRTTYVRVRKEVRYYYPVRHCVHTPQGHWNM